MNKCEMREQIFIRLVARAAVEMDMPEETLAVAYGVAKRAALFFEAQENAVAPPVELVEIKPPPPPPPPAEDPKEICGEKSPWWQWWSKGAFPGCTRSGADKFAAHACRLGPGHNGMCVCTCGAEFHPPKIP